MSFSGKLDKLMSLSGTSNIKLARALNVDPSLISRWRNGSRRPVSDLDTLANIALYMVQKLQTGYHRQRLGQAVGVQGFGAMTQDEMVEELVVWLSSSEAVAARDDAAEVRPLAMAAQPGGNLVLTGPEGRRAVLKNLYDRYDYESHGETIRFYSDEPIQWLREDIVYRKTMERRRPRLFDNVREVKLLLHANAGVDELVYSIYYVLPFLHHGTVHISRIPRYRTEIFTRTLLITGKKCAAISHSLAGSDNFVVDLLTDSAFIAGLTQDFDGLFEACEPCHTTDTAPTPQELLLDMGETHYLDEPITYIGNALPGAVIPIEVHRRVVQRLQERDGAFQLDESLASGHVADFLAFLGRGNTYYLFLPLLSCGEVKSGAATITYLGRFLGPGAELTVEEYLLALKHLLALCRQHEGLMLHIIPELDHEYGLKLQPNSMCYAVKNLESGAVYKCGMAEFIHAFTRFIEEKHGAPGAVKKARARHIQKLEEHIAGFEAQLAEQ